jgi:hypothetical protein
MRGINSEEPRCLCNRDHQVRHFVKFRNDAELGVGVQKGDIDTV